MDKFKFFDIETYKEYFCCNIHTYEDGKEVSRVSYESKNKNIMKETAEAIYAELANPDYYIVSFNGKKFDLPILAKICREINKYLMMPTTYVHLDAQSLISYDKFNNPVVKRHYRFDEWNNHHFDLLNCCLLDKSLKQWEMYNGLDIRELPYPPSQTNLTDEQMTEIRDYCHYDCRALATLFFKLGYKDSFAGKPTFLAYKELFARLEPQFQKSFDRTPGSLAATLVYKSNQPIPPKTVDPLKLFTLTDFDVPIDLKIIIAKLAKSIDGKELTDCCYRNIKYGKGGAHYARKGFVKDIYEFDVAGQYPAIIILWNLLKTSEAAAYFAMTRDERQKIKHDKNLGHINQALKLILNSLSGAFRIKSSYSLAFDPAAGEAMCYIAQLIISELALTATDDELIEVNTDSVFVTGSAVEKIRAKVVELSNKYKMVFEEEHTDAIYFADVNNYIKYTLDGDKYYYVSGKGNAYSDLKKKNSITAVYKILFNLLPEEKLPAKLPWDNYEWHEYVYKYHKSAASKYATIGDEPMARKNYYFLWTSRDCPDAKCISFSRDLINRQNGSIKARYGVYGFSLTDLEPYAKYIDYNQYHRDLDDELELWGKIEMCTTRIPKEKRKTLKDFAI